MVMWRVSFNLHLSIIITFLFPQSCVIRVIVIYTLVFPGNVIKKYVYRIRTYFMTYLYYQYIWKYLHGFRVNNQFQCV